ncbi:hypothetical protein GJ496_005630 [Pomphorhynchus laevis]|nr:hypothetical protein GJ496_005630 [Pomphorhynchus laevis]
MPFRIGTSYATGLIGLDNFSMKALLPHAFAFLCSMGLVLTVIGVYCTDIKSTLAGVASSLTGLACLCFILYYEIQYCKIRRKSKDQSCEEGSEPIFML